MLLFFGILLATLPCRALAQDLETAAEEAFAHGVAHYQRGAFDEALVAFQMAESTGYKSGELYYNMGNVYYRLNQLGQAILYFERARQLIPYNEQLGHSLRVAQSQTQNEIRYLPRPFWVQAWTWALAHLGPIGLFGLGFGLYLITAGLLGYRIWSGQPNAWVRRSMIVCSLSGMLLVAAGLFSSVQRANFRAAVIIEREATVRAAPNEMGETQTVIYEGLVCDILDTRSEWTQVYLPNGTTGWVPATAVAEI